MQIATPPGCDEAVLRSAVAAPLPGLFDYLAPHGVATDQLRRGMRLRLPFGRGTRIGFLWDLAPDSELPRSSLKRALELLDPIPLLSVDILRLLHWAADYYQHPLGEVLSTALPARLGEPETRTPEAWRLTPAGRARPAGEPRRAPRQSRVLDLLQETPRGMDRDTLYRVVGACPDVLRRLREKDWIEPCEAEPSSLPEPVPAPPLNPDQAQAVARVTAALGRFQAFLLDGVTGSGKTEVYLSLIDKVVAQGGQVLLLVPEIGLTPQLQRRLLRRVRAPVTLLHSAMADGERSRAWRQARAGKAAVLLGTRSAVFTPLPRLSLILVDEEHDLSLKQQDGFRYSARDLAVRRAQLGALPVVLGSATPSLESLRNSATGRYQRLELARRAGTAKPPLMDLIDIRSVRLQDGLSPALLRLLGENLARGQQSLLFLNRRGFAPLLSCHDCGWVAGCPHCDARLTLHQASARLWCHHCGYSHRRVDTCPACGSHGLLTLGQGTERLEETLQRLFPDTPLARVDRDSTRRRGSLSQLLNDARAGRYPLLLGTQMLAKGHHFPEVTLVALLDVDQGLCGADFRAAERMAQLVVQVAGRAGRGEKPGRVLIQTRHPDHPLLQTLIHRGYGAFAQIALEERRQALLPPFSAQALLRAEATGQDAPRRFLDAALAGAEKGQGLEFWGPVPAPMERRAGRYRAHLLVQGDTRPTLQRFLAAWVPRLHGIKEARQVRWALDVDPQEML